MKRRKKPEEDGAPAYMAQFTALMTILLAFFITMLTMGQNRNSQYKEGLGFIRDAFGSLGGTGLLPFLKTMMPGHPTVPKDPDDDDEGDFLGYKKGTFQSPRFDAKGIAGTALEKRGFSIRLATPITFATNSTLLTEDSCRYLERISGAFGSLPSHTFTACAYASTGNPTEDQILAAKRSTVISMYLTRACNIPSGQIRSVGYGHERYMGDLTDEQSNQAVVFFVRKTMERKKL